MKKLIDGKHIHMDEFQSVDVTTLLQTHQLPPSALYVKPYARVIALKFN